MPVLSKQTRSDSGMADNIPIVDLRGATPSSNTGSNLQSSIIQSLSNKNVVFRHKGVDTLVRSIPTMVLYDDKGLEIFDQITYVEDYYLTEAEIDVLRSHAEECVSKIVQDGSVFVELGCGSMRKTKYILSAIERQKKRNVTYYAVDLSESSLRESLGPLTLAFSTINFVGLLGCYEDSIQYIRNTIPSTTPKTYLWLGSSIGNLNRTEAAAFLRHICDDGMQIGDTFLCGIDRRNEPQKIALAYNDTKGVTREFILNGLDHVNAIFGAHVFDRSAFEYVSIYNQVEGRHEAYYRSLKKQVIGLRDNSAASNFNVILEEGELINVEYSYKYAREEVDELVEQGRFYNVGKWTDAKEMYDLHLFQKPPFFFEKHGSNAPLVPTTLEWEELWKAWDTVTLTMIPSSEHHLRPIALRHPYIFYLGHIPAFLDIQLTRALNTNFTQPEHYPRIFERGIDPDMDDPTICHPHSEVPDEWPPVEQVQAYKERVRERLRGLLQKIEKGEKLDKRVLRVIWMCYEHEAMHLETLLYMLVQAPTTLPPHHFLPPIMSTLPSHKPTEPARMLSFTESDTIQTGIYDPESQDKDGSTPLPSVFGWDNEKPVRNYSVKPFEIQNRMVTTAEWIEFLDSMDWAEDLIPASWGIAEPVNPDRPTYCTKTPFGLIPTDWTPQYPVAVSNDQALKYANIKGMRLPTEVELRYLRLKEMSTHKSRGNYGFRSWVAKGVEEGQDGPVNGDLWEWTGTVLDRSEEDGYIKSEVYPGYSSDFFDGKHNILLGGSWATVPRIAERESFVNWYQRGYPYVFAGFRLARNL
ncbi:hypothetical protein SpCBS45565_g05383 [Spizellomyces sp. 'palustris']|nr:hypothetical protein SpCBS45565_g05383 [Spizellomyces sp. 'palustris']